MDQKECPRRRGASVKNYLSLPSRSLISSSTLRISSRNLLTKWVRLCPWVSSWSDSLRLRRSRCFFFISHSICCLSLASMYFVSATVSLRLTGLRGSHD